jgi:tetratricopeptide (TPR) repeat protein/predicted Ser/Thr protein kinase
MAFVPGENVGPYRIIKQLGQGGMATVFKAYHPALDRYVAIKVLHPAFKQDPNFLARFQREARIVARLEHPNIVPIYDFSEHEGSPYLVMRYIEGETLKSHLKGIVPVGEALAILRPVCHALSYAHEQGVLHRDIKPSNIILTSEGQVFLTDFGLARIAQAGESTLSQDVIVGTPQYISPEQAIGRSDLDARTDIYSLSVVLFEMLTGRVPFSADTPYAIIHDHIFTPLPLPRSINPDITPEIERILLKGLAKERDDRFSNVDELLAAFACACGPGTGEKAVSAAETVAAPAPPLPGEATPVTIPAAAPVPPSPEEAIPVAVPTAAEAEAGPAPSTAVISPVGAGLPALACASGPGKPAPTEVMPWWRRWWAMAGGLAILILFCLIAAVLLMGLGRQWEGRRGTVTARSTPALTPSGGTSALVQPSETPTLMWPSETPTLIRPRGTQPPAGQSLLSTPPLAEGIAGWEQWLQGGSHVAGDNEVRMVDNPTYGKVVEFSRTSGGNDGGAAGIYQPLKADVSDYPHLYIWLVGKVLHEEGGNLANSNPPWFPEGAIQVQIKYLTTREKEQEWYHGFYAQPVAGADAEHFTKVPQGEWFTYISPDLMTLPERPWRITEFRVYGFGWEFQGQVAEVDLIGSSVASTPPGLDEAQTHLKEAQELAQRGRVDEALAEFEKAVALDPGLVDAYSGAAKLLESRGDLEGAVGWLLRGIEANPEHLLSYLHAGELLARMEKWDRAIEEFTKALEIDPTLPGAHAGLAYCYFGKGNIKEAEKEANTALRQDSQVPEAHFVLGLIMRDTGDLEGAKHEFQFVIKSPIAPDWLRLKATKELMRLKEGSQ